MPERPVGVRQKDIKETLQTLEKANLTVKPSKSHVGCTEINFLGHIVGEGNIKPDPKKTEKILTLTTPLNKEGRQEKLWLD